MMSNHNDQTAKSAKGGTAAPVKAAAETTAIPKTWDEIRLGSLVIAHEGNDDGWWEAIVTELKGEQLTVRWRDFPKYKPVVVSRKDVTFVPVS
jgi:hypothetical protein